MIAAAETEMITAGETVIIAAVKNDKNTQQEIFMKKILFPQVKGMIHGGDYNPDQWLDRPDILAEDIRLMKEAGVNSATLGVFAWSAYEPVEGEFHFDWLVQIMDELYKNGIYTILATPTGARPAWLDKAYPEAMRVSKAGVRNMHGLRHNHCITSPKFQEKAGILIRRLAQRVKDHPGLILWHINNELGGECYCPLCQEKFRGYLKEKFNNDIQKLNAEWWTAFWSHTFNDFDQIDAPMAQGEGSIMGLNLSWKEFTTWNMAQYITFEREILKEITPDVPVTTNFMHLYPGLDYHRLAKELDVVCWDSYPVYHNDYEPMSAVAGLNSFDHAIIRNLKRDQPFMLMESTPSLVNWHPFNKLRRPGVHRLSSVQAIACGSDTVQYFQWRKGRGSFDQYHGAVIDHLGRSDTRVFRDVADVGTVLKKLEPVTGSRIEAKAAVLFDWSNRWAIDNLPGLSKDKKKYEMTCCAQYESLLRLGVETDVVAVDEDLSRYALVVAPMLYLLKPGMADRLKAYVEAGGKLVMTYLSGYVNENTLNFLGGFPGDGLKSLFGLFSEEIDTLYPSDRNHAVFGDGSVYEIVDYCEIIRVEDEAAEVVATYQDDFYRNTPVVTRKKNGAGEAWYVAARMDQKGMERIYAQCLEEAGVACSPQPEGVEYHVRTNGEERFGFWLNHTDEKKTVTVKAGKELIGATDVDGEICLEPYGVAVVQFS